MFRKLLVAYDGSEESRKALKTALELSLKFGSEVHVLTIIELPRFPAAVIEVKATIERATRRIEKQHALAHMIAKARDVEIICVIQPGSKVEKIVSYVEEKNCDGLLLGYKNHSGLLRSLRGSTAFEVVSRAPCTTILTSLQRDSG